jgi:hypothetical protein
MGILFRLGLRLVALVGSANRSRAVREFHLFMQPTLWDTVRMAITGIALSFVAQRTKSAWPGIVGHSFGNLAFFLNLVRGVVSP